MIDRRYHPRTDLGRIIRRAAGIRFSFDHLTFPEPTEMRSSVEIVFSLRSTRVGSFGKQRSFSSHREQRRFDAVRIPLEKMKKRAVVFRDHNEVLIVEIVPAIIARCLRSTPAPAVITKVGNDDATRPPRLGNDTDH